MKQACDALAQKHLKIAREHHERTTLIEALKKMGTKPTPGLKLRQSLKDVGRLGISWTPQKKEPQMRSKQQSVMPTKLGTCAQKQGKKNKQEGCRWCPGMLSQPSKTTKKPLGGQTKSSATVLRPAGLSMSVNRYALLSTEPEGSSSQPSQSRIRGTDAASGSQCGSMTKDHGKATPKAGSRGEC